jgi:tripartite-type tricarboxylate transporter receptor subunit TctC
MPLRCNSWRLLAAATITLAFLHPQRAAAQDYPTRNITVVVAFAAGGFADGIARLIGQKLSARLGQNVVVENRGGAGGNIAAKLVAGAAPDGYTLLVTTTGLAINETLSKNKGFAAADLKAVAVVGSTPEVLTVHPSNPAKNLQEFLTAAQGKTVNFGTAGVGTGSHIAAEYFFKALGKVQAVHVPFQGGAPAINAAVGNHVEVLAASLAGGLAPQINSGALKGLAVASERRVSIIPNVPTYAEGGFPNFYAASWVGFFAPAQTNPANLAKLNAAINEALKDAEVQQRLNALGVVASSGTQPQADEYFRAEVEKWAKMVNSIGLATN